ncbi:MAG: hypothetical protein IJ373_02025 [Clostridia bacterium]|nr:hypothetical protein [Clostridia bacterium]MBQ8447015.1 hypothetical protein [Clostridia bacterium]MBQ8447257.1 hypothetical protein [Clostridia bacterium]
MESKKEEKIGEALLKVALGYQIAEVTEEYAEVDGALKLTKRKKTKKDVPPDLKAVQMLLESDGNDEYSGWSDEELAREKERLLRVLENGLQEQKTGDVSKVSADTDNEEEIAQTKKTAVKKSVRKKSVVKKSVQKKVAVKKGRNK